MAENNTTVSGGCGIGCFAGMLLSYAINSSIPWAILHFFIGWIYVIYALLFRFHDIKELFR